jgi:hypothetical protein
LEGKLSGVGGSIETKLVGDPEGGFWTGYDKGGVARVAGMMGGAGCGGRTDGGGCKPGRGSARPSKAEAGILWEVVVCDFDRSWDSRVDFQMKWLRRGGIVDERGVEPRVCARLDLMERLCNPQTSQKFLHQ